MMGMSRFDRMNVLMKARAALMERLQDVQAGCFNVTIDGRYQDGSDPGLVDAARAAVIPYLERAISDADAELRACGLDVSLP